MTEAEKKVLVLRAAEQMTHEERFSLTYTMVGEQGITVHEVAQDFLSTHAELKRVKALFRTIYLWCNDPAPSGQIVHEIEHLVEQFNGGSGDAVQDPEKQL
jgi:hypothetical protein